LPVVDATNYERFDKYYFRSTIAPFLQCNWDVRKKVFDAKAAIRSLREWRSAAEYYFGDFYPLGEYSTGDDVWMAWQFDRPELAAGLIQAFRRPNCPYDSARYKLRGLDPEASYEIRNLDDPDARSVHSGRELMQQGLPLLIKEQPSAVMVTYSATRQDQRGTP
jgi:hypothetical protein